MRNASNTLSNTHFSTHPFLLAKIHMGPTKLIWDPHDLVRPMWILTNQRECVEKCVLEGDRLFFFVLCGSNTPYTFLGFGGFNTHCTSLILL